MIHCVCKREKSVVLAMKKRTKERKIEHKNVHACVCICMYKEESERNMEDDAVDNY